MASRLLLLLLLLLHVLIGLFLSCRFSGSFSIFQCPFVSLRPVATYLLQWCSRRVTSGSRPMMG